MLLSEDRRDRAEAGAGAIVDGFKQAIDGKACQPETYLALDAGVEMAGWRRASRKQELRLGFVFLVWKRATVNLRPVPHMRHTTSHTLQPSLPSSSDST